MPHMGKGMLLPEVTTPGHQQPVDTALNVAQPLMAEDFYLIGSVALRYNMYEESIDWLEMAMPPGFDDVIDEEHSVEPAEYQVSGTDEHLKATYVSQKNTEVTEGENGSQESWLDDHVGGYYANPDDVDAELWQRYTQLCSGATTQVSYSSNRLT